MWTTAGRPRGGTARRRCSPPRWPTGLRDQGAVSRLGAGEPVVHRPEHRVLPGGPRRHGRPSERGTAGAGARLLSHHTAAPAGTAGLPPVIARRGRMFVSPSTGGRDRRACCEDPCRQPARRARGVRRGLGSRRGCGTATGTRRSVPTWRGLHVQMAGGPGSAVSIRRLGGPEVAGQLASDPSGAGDDRGRVAGRYPRPAQPCPAPG